MDAMRYASTQPLRKYPFITRLFREVLITLLAAVSLPKAFNAESVWKNKSRCN